MPLVSLRQLLDDAAQGGYGVGAFNVNNMEQIQAIMEAARETKSPVIVQASRGARAYTNDRFLYHLMMAATEVYPEIPTVLHLDHGNSVATCKSAIEMGFTSVMMDGSLMEDGKTPSSFDYNVKVTREVVEMAHARGVTVEGEIGCLGGIEDGHGANLDALAHLTDPVQAQDFVAATGLDALAVAIGTSHGAYKFSKKPTGQTLVMSRIIEIHDRLPKTHLVMHGSSSVPQELQDIINKYGGKMKVSAVSVWIKAPVDVLLSRVQRKDDRPLLKTGDPREVLERLLNERAPIYAEADLAIESENGPHAETVERIVAALKERGVCVE